MMLLNIDLCFSASNEELLRRLIERMGAKVEKRLDELQFKVTRVEREVEEVKAEASKIHQLHRDHMDKFVEFAGRKTREVGNYRSHSFDWVILWLRLGIGPGA